MRIVCDLCQAPALYYVAENRCQASVCARLLCEAHGKVLLDLSPGVSRYPSEDQLSGQQHEYLLHEVSIVAIPIWDASSCVYLDCRDCQGITPCVIGQIEGRAMAEVFLGQIAEYATAHTAMRVVIDALGGSLKAIVIDGLTDGVYTAKLMIGCSWHNSDVCVDARPVDARPSDAIIMALLCEAPIFVAREAVLGQINGTGRTGPID